MRLLLRSLFICLLTLPFATVKALDLPYIPQVINYTVGDYKAGNQNWAVSQGLDGKMYFGNNRGLLVFDGIRWKLNQLQNNVPIRSLHTGKDNRIYIGAFEEFGYFLANENGEYEYYSLSKLLQDFRFNNEEIWTITEHNGLIYFQSFSSYFVYDGQTVVQGDRTYSPLYFFSINNEMYAQFIGHGVFQMQDGHFVEIIPRQQLNNDEVVAVLPFDDKLLLVTVRSGLFLRDKNGHVSPWNIPVSDIIKSGTANRSIMMPDSTYVIGTISDGIVACYKHGKLLWHLNLENSLNNNCVLGLHTDKFGNLWGAFDNGISHIQVNSNLYFYEPREAQMGMVHDMTIKDTIMYLASNQGVYTISENDKYPWMIPGTEEQSWCLFDAGSQLIAGHNRGSKFIKKQKAEPITGPGGGGTAIRRAFIHGKEVLILSTYVNIGIFTKNTSGDWQFSHNVGGFSNLTKSFEVDPAGTIWASHMHKGLYRISLDETLQKAREIEYVGALDDTGKEGRINVMKLRGRIVLTDGKRFYTYEDLSNTIVPYDVLNESFPEIGDTYRIVSINNDLFWFIRNTEYLLLSYEGGRFYLKKRLPFSLFENPTSEDRGNIYIGANGVSYLCLNGGIALYDPNTDRRDSTTVSLSLSAVTASDRSNNKSFLLPLHSGERSTETVLSSQNNNVTFELAFPDFSRKYSRIRYRLVGFDNEWSMVDSEFSYSYSNLPGGSYTFQATVLDSAGDVISTLSYPFRVKPPFYRSRLAILLYFIIGICMLVVLNRTYINRVVERENKEREEYRRKQKEKLKEQEELIIRLKNEQLENEVTYKSKELASLTLTRITQSDFLEELKKEILEKQRSGTYTKRFLDKMLQMIDGNLTMDDDWSVYQQNFDRIHEQFFVKLKQRYPELTPGDLRMCALLRLNMPTKDMAKMLSLSVRGIEAARYRLRKKLSLTEGENLVDFMINFV